MRRSRRRAFSPEQIEKREEQMRPSRFIGYEHESLALHLIRIGSLDLAESELRRAVWLNPYEPRFLKHLAWCLYRKEDFEEALDWISRALAMKGEDREAMEIQSRIEARIRRPEQR